MESKQAEEIKKEVMCELEKKYFSKVGDRLNDLCIQVIGQEIDVPDFIEEDVLDMVIFKTTEKIFEEINNIKCLEVSRTIMKRENSVVLGSDISKLKKKWGVK